MLIGRESLSFEDWHISPIHDPRVMTKKVERRL